MSVLKFLFPVPYCFFHNLGGFGLLIIYLFEYFTAACLKGSALYAFFTGFLPDGFFLKTLFSAWLMHMRELAGAFLVPGNIFLRIFSFYFTLTLYPFLFVFLTLLIRFTEWTILFTAGCIFLHHNSRVGSGLSVRERRFLIEDEIRYVCGDFGETYDRGGSDGKEYKNAWFRLPFIEKRTGRINEKGYLAMKKLSDGYLAKDAIISAKKTRK